MREKSKAGRPSMPKGLAKMSRITIRVSENELKAFRERAKKLKKSLSEIIMAPWRNKK